MLRTIPAASDSSLRAAAFPAPTIDGDDSLSAWNLSAQRSVAAAASAIDEETGIIRRLSISPAEPGEPDIYHAECLVSLDGCEQFGCQASTTGAGLSADLAAACAIGEGLERYCAAVYNPDCFVIGSSNQLRRSLETVEPRAFALYSDGQHAREGFRHRRFTDDVVLAWTCGFSMMTGRDVWLPASLVHAPYREDGLATLTFPTTTGLCCAASLEEAILGGACEAIERDASICTWMNRMKCPGLLLQPESPRSTALQQRFIGCACDLRLFDITLDIRIPTVLAVLIDPARDGAAVAVGTATRPTIDIAAVKAACEAAQVRRWLRRTAWQDVEKNYRSDFADVCGFEDHVRLFGRRDALSHFDFLLEHPIRSAGTSPLTSDTDVRSRLQRCLGQLADRNLDLIVVDVTRPEVNSMGFHVVRVVIPGLTDWNADHNYPCLGGSRLCSVPRLAGYRHDQVCEAELNRVPHPFP